MDKQKHNHCGCGHCHNEVEKSEKNDKGNQIEKIKIFSSFIVFILAIILSYIKINIPELQISLFLLAYLIVGWEVIKRAIINLFDGYVIDEHFLMTIATISAFVIGEYLEAVMVMWLYKVGKFFQEYALGKSRKSITNLMNIRPEIANLERNGEIIEIEPQKVKIGEIIVVKPGEKVPLDGIVLEGESYLDTIALTGESVPRKVNVNDNIYSGCINQNGLLKIKVTKVYEDSAVSKILNLVEHASERKAKTENFINKFAKYYTPIVVILAVLLACIPPLFTSGAIWSDYIYRACSFLVISCPCALVISIPLGFFSGIGGASKFGVLVKGSNYLEILSKVKTIVVDKTGTLTKGVFEVTKINSNKITLEELLEITAMAELYSEHPIALSIKKAYGKEIDKNRVGEVEEIAGHGIFAKIDDKKVYVGNLSLMQKMQIEIDAQEIEKAKSNKIGTIVYVAMENQYLGNLVISDQIKSEAKQFVIDSKKKSEIQNIIMLTGDNQNVAEYVAKELNIDEVYAELLPYNKVEKVEEFINQKLGSVAFAGDGINDAPVLTRADVGIAMGGLGSDAAIEAADVVIMNDDLSKIVRAITHSKRTMKIIKQNIIFALLVKFGILFLGALGYANMWQAVFADVGVSFVAILNSLRAMNIKKY